MLIKAKNPDLYRAWLRAIGSDTAEKRTRAFFASQAGHIPPLSRVPA